MRTAERMQKLRDWIYSELCQGREMKTPAKNGDITKICRQEPKCYIGYFPMRPDSSEDAPEDPANVAPSILIMPCTGYTKYAEKKPDDRTYHVNRLRSYQQNFSVQVLFTVFEDGLRQPGFIEKAQAGAYDMSLIREGTEEGLFTLWNWMDELERKLLGLKVIPGTDLYLDEDTMNFGMYADQKYLTDNRPIYQGIVAMTFLGYAEEATNQQINDLLR